MDASEKEHTEKRDLSPWSELSSSSSVELKKLNFCLLEMFDLLSKRDLQFMFFSIKGQ